MAIINAYYIDTDTFGVSGIGDQTGKFHVDRRTQAWCGNDGIKYGSILSSSYGGGVNTIDLTADSDNLTINLQHVKYGIVGASPSGSLPSHDHSDDTGEGGDLSATYALKTYSDETSANALAQAVTADAVVAANAETYSDQASANALVQANLYSDSASANALAQAVTADVTVLSNAATYSDETSANALVQANLYSDGVSAQSEADDVATLASANTYSDQASANAYQQAQNDDVTVLASAATYSDQTSANAETQANAYTDTQVASVSAAADEGDVATLASAATYSDQASANALAQAVTADAVVAANAETYSDAASANALVQSWVFDDTPDSDHTSSGEWATMTVDVNTVGFGGALHLDTDGNWVDADGDAATSMPCQALALEAGTGSKKVLFRGFIRDDTWAWTVGGLIYASTSPGALTQTAPSATGDQVQVVGFATHADRMFFNPDYTLVEIA